MEKENRLRAKDDMLIFFEEGELSVFGLRKGNKVESVLHYGFFLNNRGAGTYTLPLKDLRNLDLKDLSWQEINDKTLGKITTDGLEIMRKQGYRKKRSIYFSKFSFREYKRIREYI